MESISESDMNLAGRTSDHTFADLRSASYGACRNKKYQRKQSRSKRFCCEICWPRHNLARLSRTEEVRWHIVSRPWEDDWGAELRHVEEKSVMCDVTEYYAFGKHKQKFEENIPDEHSWTASGEDFGAWGRRRINEMRTVKESRLHKQLAGPDNTTQVTKVSSQNTTLPTSTEDRYAHALLRRLLTPNKYFLRYCRVRNIPPFPSIHGFSWFGEYQWQWYRNSSGCWELGCIGGCGNCAHLYWYCRMEEGHLQWPCACAAWNGSGYWDPEDTQQASLDEWVTGENWDDLGRWEAIRRAHARIDQEWGYGEVGWEMVSDAASEGWSVVSSDEDFCLV